MMERLSPPKPRREQDALRQTPGSAPLRTPVRPSGRRVPGPCCRPQWLHRARHPRHGSRGMSLSGDRDSSAIRRFAQQSRFQRKCLSAIGLVRSRTQCANAALWTAKTVAEGGTDDLFYSMDKEVTGDDLGLTLQTAYVTTALIVGSDRFRLAVSADGSTGCRASRPSRTKTTISTSTLGRRSVSTTPTSTTRVLSMSATSVSSLRSRALTSSARRCSARSIPAQCPHARAAGAERLDRNPGITGRGFRGACLRGDDALAADHGPARAR